MRATTLATLLIAMPVALACGPAAAAGLYESRTIVTGMDGRSRPAGVQRALAQTLAKVSGDPALLDDPRLRAIDPAPLVLGIAYLDRMSDQPTRDEQGTRDRPYDLVVRFQPAAVDALLRSWNLSPWPLPRPVLGIDVTITPRQGPATPLRADTGADERHRAALLEAAGRFGLEVVLPTSQPSYAVPDGPSLRGALRWDELQAGWSAQWSLLGAGPEQSWGGSGLSFDAAYRDGVGRAARILSQRRP